jgi:hypothetical protein
MWFLNKNTGLKWEIVDKEIIKRLSKDENYKIIEEENKKIDYNSLSWQELKQLASDKGVNTYGMKKDEIIKTLQEMEG